MATATIAPPQFELRHRLALALEHGGVRPEAMAEELGCAATTVRNYLSGRTHPKKAVLWRWAEVTGVPFEWLEQGVGGSGWLHRTTAAA